MATAADNEVTLDIREQIARIDKMQVELAKLQVDTKLAIWPVLAGMLTALAGAFAAGIAVTKLFLG